MEDNKHEFTADELFSPSAWSSRLSRDKIIAEHVRFVTEESHRVHSKVPCKTYHYGPGKNEKVDVFDVEDPAAPILVYFSGGYWQELSGT